MDTIQDALDTPEQLRDVPQQQRVFIWKMWMAPLRCTSCKTVHSLAICAPSGWTKHRDFPDDLTCPNSGKKVKEIMTLFGDRWIAEKDQE